MFSNFLLLRRREICLRGELCMPLFISRVLENKPITHVMANNGSQANIIPLWTLLPVDWHSHQTYHSIHIRFLPESTKPLGKISKPLQWDRWVCGLPGYRHRCDLMHCRDTINAQDCCKTILFITYALNTFYEEFKGLSTNNYPLLGRSPLYTHWFYR